MNLLTRLLILLGVRSEATGVVGTTNAQAAPPPGPPVYAVGDKLPAAATPKSESVMLLTRVPAEGLVLLHHYESCAKKLPGGLIGPYADAVGVWTIGWGNTRWEDGRRVRAQDQPVTQARVDALFAHYAADFMVRVDALLPKGTDDDARAAFLSMAYNVGVPAFAGSTALRLFRTGDRMGAAVALEAWNKGGGQVLRGLQRRRRAERLVMLGATPDSAIAVAERAFP